MSNRIIESLDYDKSNQIKRMEIKPFKIRVNPEQSRIVQEIILKNGYRWIEGDSYVWGTEFPILVFTMHQGLSYRLMDQCPDDIFDIPELTFDEFMRLYSNESVKEEKKKYPKVYIKGDGTEEYGKKIIEYLESCGGRNEREMRGHNRCVYLIDNNGMIDWDYRSHIRDGYTETSLKENVNLFSWALKARDKALQRFDKFRKMKPSQESQMELKIIKQNTIIRLQ